MNSIGCLLPHTEREPALDGFLTCRKHRGELDRLTHEIGLLLVDSQRIVDGGAPAEQSPRVRHTKAAEAPAPGNLTLMSLFDKRTRLAPISPSVEHPDGDTSTPMVPVLAMIAGNVLLLAEERPLTAALPSSVLAQLDLLTRHHDWIAAQLWVDVYFGELRDVRQHLKSAVRDRTHILVGYCDLAKEGEPERACGGVLILENGGDTVQCKGCGATWTDPRERARLAMRTG